MYAGVKPIKEYKESIRDTWRAGLPFEEASAGGRAAGAGPPGRGGIRHREGPRRGAWQWKERAGLRGHGCIGPCPHASWA